MQIFEPFFPESFGCLAAAMACVIATIDGIRAVAFGCQVAFTQYPGAEIILGVIGAAFFLGKLTYDIHTGPPKHKVDTFWL